MRVARRLFALSFAALGCSVVTSLDDLAPRGPTGQQGDLGGACYANNTCNAGLVCVLSQGTGKCADPTQAIDGSILPPTDGGNPNADGAKADAADGSLPVCVFQPSKFPCAGTNKACYGQAQTCTSTLCGSGESAFECFSSAQCGTLPCCVSGIATLLGTAVCATNNGLYFSSANPPQASVCSLKPACDPNAIQLCHDSLECPTGYVCSPVKLGNTPKASSSLALGACQKPL